ncbi:MAG: TVP38/TMEM64 family protein [Clostridia bacterium]|nr:TVP38/TMEM64 family protein [Clostridia bacterium]
MKRTKKPKLLLLFGGLIFILLSFAVFVLLLSLEHEELWRWYAQIKQSLANLEDFILHIDIAWLFAFAILLLFAVKSVIPIYPTSTVCFLTGAVLPMYFAIPVNIIGFAVLLTVRYFWGRRFGAGNAWKIISKTDTLRKLIQQDGKGNSALLVALRLIPGVPVNSISGIYGSFDFGYLKFILFSVIGFMPRLISYTFVGRNVFDPLSGSFLVPLMLILFFTGTSLVCVNGIWITVEKTVKHIKNIKEIKEKGNINHD